MPRLVAGLLAAVLTVVLSACGSNNTTPSGQVQGVTSQGRWEDIPQIAANLQPSVVTVLRTDAEGSGVVWSKDGMIVTNNHVVEGVTDVTVAFADGQRVPGKVLATDPLSDLAVVKASRGNLPPATFDTALPPVGSLAIAIGNPLGFENSVTAGIVSGLHRSIPGAAQEAPSLIDLVQTDAPISPGNSGGALVGGDGHIIGINVAFIPPQARAVAIGFAIPAPTVTSVVTQLIETGHAVHAYLGIQPAPLTPQIAQQLKVDRNTGAVVADVAPGSPAASAGIQPGDVIIGIDGKPVNMVEDLLAAIREHKPGDQVTLQIERLGKKMDVQVTLGAFPSPS